ncbi:MAG: hypothetical protein AAFQ29_09150 [Pseudomonadota bacterium]
MTSRAAPQTPSGDPQAEQDSADEAAHDAIMNGELSDEEALELSADPSTDDDRQVAAVRGPSGPEANHQEWLATSRARFALSGRFEGGERDWHGMSRQVWQLARLCAGFLFFAMLVGWPLGSYLAHRDLTGSGAGWSLLGAYPAGIILFAVVVPMLVLFAGYVLSRAMTTAQAGEAIADAARYYVEPDTAALREVETVGTAVRAQMDVLNTGLNTALMRLAEVEAMIRTHVDAIEKAGSVMETKASNAVDKVATERSRLMDLTETLNLRADDFAQAIAVRTEANIAALEKADSTASQSEAQFAERLDGLEQAAGSALSSFQTLADALGGADNQIKSGTAALHSSTERAKALGEEAKANTRAAIDQTVIDEAARANLDTVKQAVSIATQASSDEAIALAQAEATRIAEAAVKSAEAQIEKIAQQAGDTIETTAAQATEAARTRRLALTEAHAELEEENARLEKLIDEQQKRAERLAQTIALQTERLTAAAKAIPDIEAVTAARSAVEAPNTVLRNEGNRTAANGAGAQGIEHGSQSSKTSGSEEKPRPLRWRFGDKEPREGEPAPEVQAHDPEAAATSEPAPVLLEAEQPVQTPREDLERLGELARDLAERRDTRRANGGDTPPSGSRQRANKGFGSKSWKDILAAADGAQPLDLRDQKVDDQHTEDTRVETDPASEKPAVQPAMSDAEVRAITVIERLQHFTRVLDSRLYGASPPGLIARFEKGDRNVFANRLLRLNEGDVKKRIRLECAKDRQFERDIRRFLSDFDGLLEEAAQSDFVDDELREYLGSPLGRMYLLIGEIVGYFA